MERNFSTKLKRMHTNSSPSCPLPAKKHANISALVALKVTLKTKTKKKKFFLHGIYGTPDQGSAPNLESPTSMSGQIELQSEHVAKREIPAHTWYVCQSIPFLLPPRCHFLKIYLKSSNHQIIKSSILYQLHHPYHYLGRP